jgi:hypothetical protein
VKTRCITKDVQGPPGICDNPSSCRHALRCELDKSDSPTSADDEPYVHHLCRLQHDVRDREALTPVSALAAILPGSAGGRGCAEPTPLALQLTPEAAGGCDSPVLAAGRPAAGGYGKRLNTDGASDLVQVQVSSAERSAHVAMQLRQASCKRCFSLDVCDGVLTTAPSVLLQGGAASPRGCSGCAQSCARRRRACTPLSRSAGLDFARVADFCQAIPCIFLLCNPAPVRCMELSNLS